MADTPKVAVCGAGYWGKNLVRNFHELGALGTVCDADPGTLEQAADTYGVGTTDSYTAVLSDPEIDAVVLATPAVAHHSMARAALLADKDVFVEKPLALTVPDGEELVALAAERGRVLQVGHILDYHPAVVRLLELVSQGALGKLHYVYSRRLNLGKVRREENILWSFAPHDVSLISRIAGAEPVTVTASGGNYLQPHVADVTLTHLAFPGGVRGHIFVSWLHPVKEQRLVVVGSKAMVVFDDQQPWDKKLLLYEHTIDWIEHRPVPKKAEARAVAVDAGEPMRRECEDFLQCIAQRGRPHSDGRSGLAVLRVLDAAQRSLESGGQPVELAAGVQPALPYRLHETAVVDEGATIGAGTSIWHFSHVMPGATIGERCSFGQNVYVASDVRIGDNVKVQNNVSIYDGVELEDDVFCGPSMVFTNVGTPRSHYPRRDAYSRTVVRRGASLGANSTIVCGNEIGAYSLVGAGAVVTRDVPAHALVVGAPARLAGWRCYCGTALRFQHLDTGQEQGVACEECGRTYGRDGTTLTLETAPTP